MSQENSEINKEFQDSEVETLTNTIILENENIEARTELSTKSHQIEKKPFLEPLKTNRFFLIRVLYHILRSIWIVAMIVGGFIAWIISLLFI